MLAEDVARAHDHAIGRRAAHREMARADFAQPQRIVQRQRMRDAGLIEFRRHHPDVVGQRARDLLDDLQAGGVDAVVIGAENSHPSKCLLFDPRPVCCRRAPSYPAIAAEANPANHRVISSIRTCQGRTNFALPEDPHVKFRRRAWRLGIQRCGVRFCRPRDGCNRQRLI